MWRVKLVRGCVWTCTAQHCVARDEAARPVAKHYQCANANGSTFRHHRRGFHSGLCGRPVSATRHERTFLCAAARDRGAHEPGGDSALRARHDLGATSSSQRAGRPQLRGRPTPAAATVVRPRAGQEGPLSDSGVYYVPFGQPLGARGAGSVALHVADGSQVIAERIGGRRLTILVGAKGRERYASCLARLGAARLASGYQPIMTTTYTDASRVRYRQESFAAQASETGSLVSFIRLDIDAASASTKAVQLRLKPSVRQLRRALAFSRGGTVLQRLGY